MSKGKLKSKGFADLYPGDTLELDGLSDRFNGKVFIGGVRHVIKAGDWVTELGIGLSDEWYIQENPNGRKPCKFGLGASHKRA